MNRRQLLRTLSLSSLALSINKSAFSKNRVTTKPIVLSTWYNQRAANDDAWSVLKDGGNAIDAVEKGVMVSENDWENCCVGLGANPDRDGIVTLDACIMDHKGGVGSVAALERIKNPILVARAVMDKTPHVMLVGQGAQEFAQSIGLPLEELKLSEHAKNAYADWLKKSEYKPLINIEKGVHGPQQDGFDNIDANNHDTIGMIALDSQGNLSGACTTSGMGFKMHGRVGDSPIIGAGLFVDNEVGAATATGLGEEVIRICGTHLVVEYMRQGYSPEQACRKAVERIKNKTPRKLADIQIGFIALNKYGEFGAYSLQPGFDYAVMSAKHNNVKFNSKSLI